MTFTLAGLIAKKIFSSAELPRNWLFYHELNRKDSAVNGMNSSRLELNDRVSALIRTLIFGALAFFAFETLRSDGRADSGEWDPVAPADLAAKDSLNYPGVSSEFIFARSELEQNEEGYSLRTYIRKKIYTQAGIEKETLQKIIYGDTRQDRQIFDITGRVIKPDGTTVEVKQKDFNRSEMVEEVNDESVKQVSFAFPNLAIGDIIECRWRERGRHWLTLSLICQDTIPVREYRFSLRCRGNAVLAAEHCADAHATGNGSSRSEIVIRNLPPFIEENHLPAELDVRGWVRLFYEREEGSAAERWQRASEERASFFDDKTKLNDELKQKAAELVAGANTDDEKLLRLYNFCQSQIINYDWNDTPAIISEKDKINRATFQTASKTLERKKGFGVEVDCLFGALARAAGFEVKRAVNASRNRIIDVNIARGWEFMTREHIAVKLGAQWRFFSPGEYFVPCGRVHSEDEGALALICEKKTTLFYPIPVSAPEASKEERHGHFNLSEDGSLEGEITETFAGDLGVEKKKLLWPESPSHFEKDVQAAVIRNLPTAEVSNVRFENERAQNLPLILHYTVHVPDYAKQIGQRLIFAPNYFQVGIAPEFSAEKRLYAIMYARTWSVHDDIEIKLPDGFVLDHPSAPGSIGDGQSAIRAIYKVSVQDRQHTLIYHRDFAFGANRQVLFPASVYPSMKETFDAIHRSDDHALILKPVTGAMNGSETKPSRDSVKDHPASAS